MSTTKKRNRRILLILPACLVLLLVAGRILPGIVLRAAACFIGGRMIAGMLPSQLKQDVVRATTGATMPSHSELFSAPSPNCATRRTSNTILMFSNKLGGQNEA